MQLFHLARGFKMEESESSVVSETESETGRPGERQGQLYTKTKKGKAVGIPTTVFLPKEETFTAWKSSIRSAIAELESRGGYSHTLPIRVCAAQRGRDFEAPDLERGIHFRGVF